MNRFLDNLYISDEQVDFSTSPLLEEKYPRCSNIKILGQGYGSDRTLLLEHLSPFTTHWVFLVPHYKGVIGHPSNMKFLVTPEDGIFFFNIFIKY